MKGEVPIIPARKGEAFERLRSAAVDIARKMTKVNEYRTNSERLATGVRELTAEEIEKALNIAQKRF